MLRFAPPDRVCVVVWRGGTAALVQLRVPAAADDPGLGQAPPRGDIRMMKVIKEVVMRRRESFSQFVLKSVNLLSASSILKSIIPQ